jgi:hypothetical protein
MRSGHDSFCNCGRYDKTKQKEKQPGGTQTDDGSGQARGFFLVRRHAMLQEDRGCCQDNAFLAVIVCFQISPEPSSEPL